MPETENRVVARFDFWALEGGQMMVQEMKQILYIIHQKTSKKECFGVLWGTCCLQMLYVF